MGGALHIPVTVGLDLTSRLAGATVIESLFGSETRPGVLLLVTAVMLWMAYLGLRIAARFRIPVVTAFLLIGAIAGPSGLDLLSQPILDALGIIEPVALGLITFSAGEQLVLNDVLGLARRNVLGVALETLMPLLLVAVVILVATGRPEIALPLGAIAGTTGIATVVATLKDRRARGSYTKLLSVAIATDNVIAILVFTLVLPVAMALEEAGGMGTLYLRSLGDIVLSVLMGGGAGALLARNIGRIRSSSELSMFVLAHLLLVVAVVDILGGSVLLAGLSMGILAVNLSSDEREREWLFRSLAPLEDPLIAVFFLWAGAGLHVTELGEVGLVAVLYLAARTAGKILGPRLAAVGSDSTLRETWELKSLGYGLLPQAGAAIGLAILARDVLPVAGDEILTVVLGAVIVFELTGPLAITRAVNAAGEATESPPDAPMTLSEAVQRLEERKGRLMAVTDPTTTVWQLANTVSLAQRLQADLILMRTGEPPSSGHGNTPGRDPVEALKGYAEGHEQKILVLPECSGDVAGGIVEAAREHQPDLLILAWGPYRRRLAPLVVEAAPCPVVELPEPSAGVRSNRRMTEAARSFTRDGVRATVRGLRAGRRKSP